MDYVKLWVRPNFNVPSSGRKRRRKRGSRREWIRDAVEDADREKKMMKMNNQSSREI